MEVKARDRFQDPFCFFYSKAKRTLLVQKEEQQKLKVYIAIYTVRRAKFLSIYSKLS